MESTDINIGRETVGIDEALEFARKAERAYRDGHGIDFEGMRYAFNDGRDYGWAIPEDQFRGKHFRESFGREHDILHKSDGSVVERGDEHFYKGPVTLITPHADKHQHDTVHELGHHAFRARFALGHKPKPGKVRLPGKVCLTVGDGISEHMCYEEMHNLMDEGNARMREKNWARYEDQLNRTGEFEKNGFDTWKDMLSDSVNHLGPDFRHAVGLNFVLVTFEYGTKLSQYLDLLARHPPTEEHILNPFRYRETAGI